MTAPIEDVSSLPGKKVSDQGQVPIGEIKEIYAMDDGFPMWIALETKASDFAEKRIRFVPLARLKEEQGDLLVPYSKHHIINAPEVDHSDGLSEEADQKLRGYYGIGTGDQEMRSDNKSYAALVSDEGGAAQRVEDADQLETPNPDRRTDQTRERADDPGGTEASEGAGDRASGDASDGDSGEAKEDDRKDTQEDDEGNRDE